MSTTLNLPCAVAVKCFPCFVSPLANLTSEAPDVQIFIGESWNPPGNNPVPPPLGGLWTSTGCLGLCESTISQDDADVCAANQVMLCIGGQQPGLKLYENSPQSCTVYCPDGSPFTYTVAAGTIILDNQSAADSAAYQLACIRANSFRICFGSLTRCTCINAQYSSTVTVTGGVGSLQYGIFSGSLPPGLSLSGVGHAFTISGTPTVNGTYSFTIQGVDSVGNFMRKTYSIVVLEITTVTIPPYTVGSPYSFQLVASGGSGNYNWKIVNGSLPNGLTMSLTGLISGTPT